MSTTTRCRTSSASPACGAARPVGSFNPDAELQKNPIAPVAPETLPRLVRNRRPAASTCTIY